MSARSESIRKPTWSNFPEWIIRWRVVVVAVIVLITALALYQAQKLKLIIDMNATLPQSHPYIAATNDVERVFGSKYVVVVGLSPKQGDIYNPLFIDKVKRVSERLSKVPGILAENMGSISARRAKSISSAADSIEVQALVGKGPTSLADVDRLKQAIASNPVFLDGVVSRDGHTAAVIAEFKEPARGFRSILDQVEAIADAERDGGTEINIGGLPSYLAATEKYSERMVFLLPIAIGVLALVLYAGFRTRQGPVLPLLTAMVAVSWGIGVMGALGIPLDVFNATTPILVLAVATGHAVQMLKRYYEEYERIRAAGNYGPREANVRAVSVALARVAPVMIAAGVVAALGFFSLMIFEIATVRTFGLFTGIGILAALVLEMTLIPAVRSMLAPPSDHAAIQAGSAFWNRLTNRIGIWVTGQQRRTIYAVFGAGILFALVGMNRIVIDNSVKSFFSDSSLVSQEDRILNQRLAGTNTVYILIESGAMDGIKDPATLRAIDELESYLQTRPNVGKTVSIAYFIKRMNQAMHGNDPQFYRIPEDPGLVAQYLMLYSISGSPSDFDAYVDNDYSKANLTVYLKSDSSRYVEVLIKEINAFTKDRMNGKIKVRVGGSVPQSAALSEVMVRDKLLNIAQIGGVVFVISALMFRSLIGGLLVLLPLLVAVIANFGLMGWSGILLNVPTSLTSAMAVGIGADYAIYLIYRLREELSTHADEGAAVRRVISTAGQAILFVALAVAAGYGVLLLSFGFKVHQWLAILIACAMIVSALAALFLIPSLLLTFRPNFVFKRSS
jgi:predicted RND superfamily exporter protein